MDAMFEVNNSQFSTEILKAVFYLFLILGKIVICYFSWRKLPSKGTVMMVIGSLGILLPMSISFADFYLFPNNEYSAQTLAFVGVLSILFEGSFVLGLYFFVTQERKTTRLPMKEDGLS